MTHLEILSASLAEAQSHCLDGRVFLIGPLLDTAAHALRAAQRDLTPPLSRLVPQYVSPGVPKGWTPQESPATADFPLPVSYQGVLQNSNPHE